MAAFETVGRPDDGGHAGDGVVHRPLLAVAVISEAVAVVRGEDDDGVFEVTLPLKGIQNLAHFFVDH